MAQVTTPNYTLNTKAPTWQSYSPTKMSTSPTWEGLMGSDYDALQTALQTPGEISARQAYTLGQTNLANTMGGKGLYGSSIMANQARTALDQPYIDALATNAAKAAASRYTLQQADLSNKNTFGTTVYGEQMGENTALQQLMAMQNYYQNTFGTDIYGKQLTQEQNMNQYGLDAAKAAMTQNQNVYNASSADAARYQDYLKAKTEYENTVNTTYTDWQNAQDLEKFQYNLATANYGNQQNTALINQYLALAGYGAPLASTNATNTTNSNAGYLNAGVTLAGLLGNYALS
jgi:hypothetical protein